MYLKISPVVRGLKELRVKIFFVFCRQHLIRVYLTFQLVDKKPTSVQGGKFSHRQTKF